MLDDVDNDHAINNEQDIDHQDVSQRLSALAMPSNGSSTLMLISIRHTTLLCAYTITLIANPVLQAILSTSSADFVNIFLIATNLITFMLYPVGDSFHRICCKFVTKRIFFHWWDVHLVRNSILVDEITQKYVETNDNVSNINNHDHDDQQDAYDDASLQRKVTDSNSFHPQQTNNLYFDFDLDIANEKEIAQALEIDEIELTQTRTCRDNLERDIINLSAFFSTNTKT